MQFKKASLLLVLPLIVAACDSSQPTYSASNANATPPPAAVAPAPPPVPPPQAVAAPAPVTAQAAPAPALAPAKAPRPTWRDASGAERWQAPAQAGKMGPVAKIGVGTCDDYVERYRTCFNSATLSHDQRAPLRRTLADQLRRWKADTDAGKISQVAAACTAAERTARESFRKVGCTTF